MVVAERDDQDDDVAIDVLADDGLAATNASMEREGWEDEIEDKVAGENPDAGDDDNRLAIATRASSVGRILLSSWQHQ